MRRTFITEAEARAWAQSVSLEFTDGREFHVLEDGAGGFLVADDEDLPAEAWPDRMIASYGTWDRDTVEPRGD
jgi:hypothetical protein